MISYLILFSFLSSILATRAPYTPYICPNGFTLFNGRCWKYESSLKNWNDAKFTCQALGAELADPRTDAENQFVNNFGCRNNTAVFPSPWSIWSSSQTSFGSANPQLTCICTPPPGSNGYVNFCQTVPGNPSTVVGQSQTGGTCTLPPSPTSNNCPSPSRTCRVPTINHPNGVSLNGRGICWIGLERKGLNSAPALTWSVSSPTFVPLAFNRLHSELFATNPVPTQSSYVKTNSPSPGSSAPPQCGAIWNFNVAANWILAYCFNLYPFVCTIEASCEGGYTRTDYTLTPTPGVVTVGRCDGCPNGQYRAFSDPPGTCLPCAAGYFGSGAARNSSTCSGVCGEGTFCPPGSATPIDCLPRYYGRRLASPAGPGYATEVESCALCPAGLFCPNFRMTTNDLANPIYRCDATFCGVEGMQDSRCSRKCVAGYYCPAGTSCPGRPCGDGGLPGAPVGAEAYCPEGSSEPKRVETGYYTFGGANANISTNSAPCTSGFFCSKGVRIACPIGQYSDTTSQFDGTFCANCTSGYFCAGSSNPSLPGATSPTQEVCAPANATHPAEYYCIQGVRYQIESQDFYTLPENDDLFRREYALPCPSNKICKNGIALDRLKFDNCPNGVRTVSVAELSAARTGIYFNASLQGGALPQDYNLDYRVLNQSFFNPSILASAKSTNCKNGITSNDGIFFVDLTTSELRLNRAIVDPYDPTKALQFEVCEPITDIRYTVQVQASARQKNGPIQANITCSVTVVVTDTNDQPVFPQLVYNRFIEESAPENTQAAVCVGNDTSGCPNDANPSAKNEIEAFDEDFFGQSNLNYSFVGSLSPAMQKLKINSCTGLISQKGGSANILRYSDPSIIAVNGVKKLTYTVRAADDGNQGVFPAKFQDVTVNVYIKNVNDRPIFTSSPPIELWIPESTSSRRYPAGTFTTPDTLGVFDDDPDDVPNLSLFLSIGDSSAFTVNNSKIMTTQVGEQIIDFESSKKFYSLEIGVRDPGGLTSVMPVSVRVVNINDAPIYVDNILRFFVRENSGVDIPVCSTDTGICAPTSLDAVRTTDPDNVTTDITTYSLTLNPGNRFKINPSTGQISVNTATINFEDTAHDLPSGTGRGYVLTVRANSSGAGVVTQTPLVAIPEVADKNLTIFIVDVNEDPIINTPTSTQFLIPETAAVSSILPIVISATDEDNADTILRGNAAPQQQLTFSISPTSSGPFDGAEFFSVTTDPNNATRARVVLSKPLNYESAFDCAGGTKCYTLRIRVVDDGAPQGVDEETYNITILNVNEPPAFTQNVYFLNISEDSNYFNQVDLTSSVSLTTTDADIGGVNNHVYEIVFADDFSKFSLVSLGAGNGFKIVKRTNTLINFEVKSSYTLRVRVTDNGGASSTIGRSCTIDQGVSVNCNGGSTCISGICHEICPSYSNLSTTISSSNVPRINTYFCQNLTGLNGLTAVPSSVFRETAEADIRITVLNANDPPFIVPAGVTQPDFETNLVCKINSQVSVQRMPLGVQLPFRNMLVWDDDPAGPWGFPFNFSKVLDGGNIWTQSIGGQSISLDTTTGQVTFPSCNSGCPTDGAIYSGTINVRDSAGANSNCTINITLSATNGPPSLNDRTLPSFPESDGAGTVIFEGFTNMSSIDLDVLSGDVLTFSTTASPFFFVNSSTGQITLLNNVDFESNNGAPRTIAMKVVDKFGAQDTAIFTVQVTDVNEPPFWRALGFSGEMFEKQTVPFTVLSLTGQFDDPDTSPSFRNLALSLRPDCGASCPFELSGQNIVLKSSFSGITDFEGLNSWTFTVRVTDQPGLFSDVGVQISLKNVNEPPTFLGTPPISVPEGNGGPTGRELLDLTIYASDPDAGDTPLLVFNITSGNIGDVFEIRGTKLFLGSHKVTDFETLQSYTLGLSVTDPSGASANSSVTVPISNVNDVTVSSIAITAGPNLASNRLTCDGTSSTITINGTNFGLVAASPATTVVVTYRRSVPNGFPAAPKLSAVNCQVFSRNTVITCQINRGSAGSNLLFDVGIFVSGMINGDFVNNTQTTISYPDPVLSSVSGASNLNTAGGQQITLTGSCLGSPSDQLSFGITPTSDHYVEFCQLYKESIGCNQFLPVCASTSNTGNTIVCTSIPGLGNSLSFAARIAGKSTATLNSGYSYGRPTVTASSITVLKTSGASGTMFFNGTNFGILGSAPNAANLYFVDHTSTQHTWRLLGCTVSIAHTQIRCTSTTPGVGINIRIEFDFGGQTNPSSPFLRFEPATVTKVEITGQGTSPTIGGKLVTIEGTSFGPICGVPGESLATPGVLNCNYLQANYSRGSVSVTTLLPIVYVPFVCAVVVEDTRIVCATVEGTGAGHRWLFRIGSQDAFVSQNAGTTSYSSPVVGAYAGKGSSNALTSGFEEIILIGAQYGPVGGAVVIGRYGPEGNTEEYSALNCRVTTAHERITCNTTVGAGASLSWKVYVDSQESFAQLSDYGPPALFSANPSTSLSDVGGTVVTINGNNFGPPFSTAYLESVTYGPPSNRLLFDVTTSCTVTSHETLACTVVPGLGQNLRWRVTVRGQTSTEIVSTAYATPSIISLSTTTSNTRGGERIRLLARNVGYCSLNNILKILVTGLTSTTPFPVLNVFLPGAVDPLPYPCPSSFVTTDRLLEFAVPEMTGSKVVQISLRVENPGFESGFFETSSSLSLTYGDPVITEVYAEPGENSATISVTLIGNNFCASELCCQTILDGSVANNVALHTHDRITFTANGPGSAYVQCPGVRSETVTFDSQNPYVYGATSVDGFVRLDQTTFNTIGDQFIYIFTLYATASSTVKIGGKEATNVTIASFDCASASDDFRPDTVAGISSILLPGQVCVRIKCRVPPGSGSQNDIVVSVGSLKSRADDFRFEFLQYTPPSIQFPSSSFSISHPTPGSSTILTVSGLNFGPASSNGEILFGPTSTFGTRNQIVCGPSSPGYNWTQTSASCAVPPGEGRSLQVRVRVSGQTSNALSSATLSYIDPVITDFSVVGSSDNTGDTIGGQTLVIIGTNFGRPYNSSAIATSPGYLPSVDIGTSLICQVQSLSHTSLRCTIPPGEGAGFRLAVTFGTILVESPIPFSYGRPVIFFLNPATARTDAINSDGSPVILQVVGKNFGVNDLQLQFQTAQGRITLATRNNFNLIDTFIYPGTNHTSLRARLPSFFGANLTVTVVVARQSSNDSLSPKFSYSAPVITNVTRTVGGRILAEVIPAQIDNEAWDSQGFGNCLPLRAGINTTSSVYVNVVYKQRLVISSGGAFTRTFRFYTLPNKTSLSEARCNDPTRFIEESAMSGTFTDLGEHPEISCIRIYQSTVSSTVGTIDPRLYPEGGFGLYLISENQDIFISLPSFTSYEDARQNSDSANYQFEDRPHATLVVPPTPLEVVPASGCDNNGYEDISVYNERVKISFGTGDFSVVARRCLRPILLSVSGENFGSGLLAPKGSLRVFLVDSLGNEYEGATTSSGGNHELSCEDFGCTHEDTEVTFQVPQGAGKGLRIKVVVGNQITITPPRVDYELPSLEEMNPGSIASRYAFISSLGNETVELIGENLGFETSSFSVLINGKACRNLTWVTGFPERLGRSSLRCTTPVDTPGVKSIFTCAGRQGRLQQPVDEPDDIAALQSGNSRGAWNTTSIPSSNFSSTVRALASGHCPRGTYGRIGEPCLPCPIGGVCDPGFQNPRPSSTFSLLTMDIESRRAKEGSCPQARTDRSFIKQFPDMVFYETCSQMVRCIPEEACEANNVCSEGYQYQMLRCVDKRYGLGLRALDFSKPEVMQELINISNGTTNQCGVYYDAQTKTYRGVDSDCQKNTAPGSTCDFQNPEDCSVCQVYFETDEPSSAKGICTCTFPSRCALCTATSHYRLNNECVPCPDNPALVFSLFILAIVACICLAYYLQKRKINLAFLSIGVDYFQVLAVLATTNVPWPPLILTLFRIFSIFLASIDIAAPECLVPNLEFSVKFYMTELLPLACLAILLSVHAGYTIHKVYKQGKRAKWLSHVSRLVGLYVLIIYVLYLSLTKKALDVFNCNPLDPDDGYSYTSFSSLNCDGGGLCRCNDPGGIQESLIAPAIVFLAIYTFGFPAFIFYVNFKHREQIREDQYLRANHLGDRRETNRNAYDIRKRYQLMYMYFKPRYSYWMLCILGRKFGVAFASLMFRGNPSFQLAVILVVLFVAFTLQVSNRPFMSPGEFPVVVKELNDNSKLADEDPERYQLYRELYRKVGEAARIQTELARKEKMLRHKMGAGFWDESRQAAREHDERSATEKYFFDLNAVEAVLLGATIIFALSGVMFESGRLNRADQQWQADLVVTLVFITLFSSLVYYALVFINEIWPHYFAKWCGRCFLKYQHDGITSDDLDKMKDNEIVLDANPLFAATGPVGDKSKTLQKEIDASKEALLLAKRQNDELKRLKAELEGGSGVTAKNPIAISELMGGGKN